MRAGRRSNRGRSRWSRHRHIALALGLAVAALSGCRDTSVPSRTDTAAMPQQAAAADGRATDWFVDRAKTAGIDFAYFNGMSGHFYFPEMLGGGVALLDYDNDGDLDIYFAQGQ